MISDIGITASFINLNNEEIIKMYSIYEIKDHNGVDGGTLNLNANHDAGLKGDLLLSIIPEHGDETVSVWISKEQLKEISDLVNK